MLLESVAGVCSLSLSLPLSPSLSLSLPLSLSLSAYGGPSQHKPPGNGHLNRPQRLDNRRLSLQTAVWMGTTTTMGGLQIPSPDSPGPYW